MNKILLEGIEGHIGGSAKRKKNEIRSTKQLKFNTNKFKKMNGLMFDIMKMCNYSVLPKNKRFEIIFEKDNIVGVLAARQCYVRVPKDHPYCIVFPENDDDLDMHGGCTWTGTPPVIKGTPYDINEPCHWFGWDYCHQTGNQYFDNDGVLLSYGVRVTYDELYKNCLEVCKKAVAKTLEAKES